MEKLINPYDKEFMRMAILKHEETFKEQVYELHRLYRIQKILMNNNIESSRPNKGMKLDLEQPAEKYIAESNGDGMLEIIDESEIELTLGPTNYTSRRKKPETTPTSSDSGASLSSSSTGSSHINRTNIRASEVSTGTKLGLVQVPDSSLKNEKLLRQQERLDQQQPPWLFQVLSLNMT